MSLTISQGNGCQYCLSAHTMVGRNAGLTLEQIQQVRAGKATDPRHVAISGFTNTLVETRGGIDTKVLDGFKAAGLSASEIVSNVTGMTLSNFDNNIARTEIDFPVVFVAISA